MTHRNMLKLSLMTGVIFGLAACATPQTAQTTEMAAAPMAEKAAAPMAEKAAAPMDEKATEAQTMKEVADELTATKNITKSADGEMICKREAVIGSKFKRKVCASAAQWQAMADESRKTTGDIQRRGSGPGTTN